MSNSTAFHVPTVIKKDTSHLMSEMPDFSNLPATRMDVENWSTADHIKVHNAVGGGQTLIYSQDMGAEWLQEFNQRHASIEAFNVKAEEMNESMKRFFNDNPSWV